MRISKEQQYQIAEAVWLDRIDGLHTATIAEKFNITTAQAYSELIKILRGRSNLFPFEYLADYDGVAIGNGRIFVKNGDDDCNGKAHCYWFYT